MVRGPSGLDRKYNLAHILRIGKRSSNLRKYCVSNEQLAHLAQNRIS